MTLSVADDGFHAYGRDPLWQESWYFDWSQDDGSVAGFARQGFYANLGEAWFWLYLFVDGRTIAVRDHHVPLGDRWGRHEHRTDSLWWDFRPQEPLQAWSLQAETFGIAVDDPAEFLTAEVGDRVAVGLDISFEALAPPYQWRLAAGRPRDDDGTPSSRYEQFGSWSGDILLGDRTIHLDGRGERDHSWGRRDWWSAPWIYTAFNFGPDLAFHAAGPDIPGVEAADGYVWRDGSLHPVTRFAPTTRYDEKRLPREATFEFEDEGGGRFAIDVTPEWVTPLAIEPRSEAPGPTLFRRGPAAFRLGDRTGRGDVEYNHPLSGPFADLDLR